MNNQRLVERLRESKVRLTKERLEILSGLERQSCIFSVKDVYDNLAPESGINLATVYRFLSLLRDKGLVSDVASINDAQYFKITEAPKDHQHLVCNSCRQIICTKGLPVSRRIAKEEIGRDFDVTEVTVILQGFCANCQKRRKGEEN